MIPGPVTSRSHFFTPWLYTIVFLVMTARCSKELSDLEGSAMVEDYGNGSGSGYGYGYGSGSGEGSREESGSGSGIPPSPSPSVIPECIAPSDFVTINEDDMVLRAKCRVSCLEKVSNDSFLRIIIMTNYCGTPLTLGTLDKGDVVYVIRYYLALL